MAYSQKTALGASDPVSIDLAAFSDKDAFLELDRHLRVRTC